MCEFLVGETSLRLAASRRVSPRLAAPIFFRRYLKSPATQYMSLFRHLPKFTLVALFAVNVALVATRCWRGQLAQGAVVELLFGQPSPAAVAEIVSALITLAAFALSVLSVRIAENAQEIAGG